MLTSLAGVCGDLGRAGQHALAPAKKKKEDGKNHDKYSATSKRARLWRERNQSQLPQQRLCHSKAGDSHQA